MLEQVWDSYYPTGHSLSRELRDEVLYFLHEWIMKSQSCGYGIHFQDFCYWFRDIVERILKVEELKNDKFKLAFSNFTVRKVVDPLQLVRRRQNRNLINLKTKSGNLLNDH